jgi:hypothetical protein
MINKFSVLTLCQEKITRFKNDNSSYRKSGISYLRCSQIVVNNTTFGFKLNFNVKDFIDGIFISFDFISIELSLSIPDSERSFICVLLVYSLRQFMRFSIEFWNYSDCNWLIDWFIFVYSMGCSLFNFFLSFLSLVAGYKWKSFL